MPEFMQPVKNEKPGVVPYPVISALGKLSQESQEFKTILGYTVLGYTVLGYTVSFEAT